MQVWLSFYECLFMSISFEWVSFEWFMWMILSVGLFISPFLQAYSHKSEYRIISESSEFIDVRIKLLLSSSFCQNINPTVSGSIILLREHSSEYYHIFRFRPVRRLPDATFDLNSHCISLLKPLTSELLSIKKSLREILNQSY